MNILQVKSIKLTYNLYVRYGFWRFLPFFKSLFCHQNGHTRFEYDLLILRVKCSYFEIFIVVNRPYFRSLYYSL